MNIKSLILTLITLLLIVSPLLATKAKLQLDTGGHTDVIWDIITTDSGEIISASADKTIRVWDTKTGKEKRKILGQIGVGFEGEIFAIALSPDKRYLAVGGYLGNSSKNWGNIRIYNYKTGKLQYVLKSHSSIVFDLSFSSDGIYLISGSADRTAKIWSVRDSFSLDDTITFHKNYIYAVKIIKTKNVYFAITASWDNQIALYDMQKKEVIKHHKLKYKLQYLAVSNKLKNIAVCGFGREIIIYDFSLNFITKIKSKTIPAGLNYSKDSRYLIAGFSFNFKKPTDVVNIYKTTNNYNTPLFSVFNKYMNLTKSVNFIEIDDKTYAVSGGGINNEIYIWDINTKKIKTQIVGVGKRVWSVGINGDNIAWGNKWQGGNTHKGGTKLQKEINLKTFRIKNEKLKIKNFKTISTINGAYTLKHIKGGGAYGHNDRVLNILKDGKVFHQIIRDATNGYHHICYGWYKDFIISGGSNGHLKIYNKYGKEVASLIGHTGEIWSIALNGDKLVSGSNDQTIKIWDLSKLKSKKKKLKINETLLSEILKKYNLTREQVLKIAQTNNRVYNTIYIFPKLYPQLNLFISKNNDWVAWTPNGFFDASKNGAKYIGYHINHGAEHEAEFLPISHFKKLYRPDLIAKAINGEDISQYAKKVDISSILNKK